MSRRAIVIVADGLCAGRLGPYGGEVDTPAFNEFAAESLLFENALTDSLDLQQVCRSWWLGLHAMCAEPDSSPLSLPQMLAERGKRCLLVTDEPKVTAASWSAHFTDRVALPGAEAVASESLERTALAGVFAAALELLEEEPPVLTWLHVQACRGPCDAPQQVFEELREYSQIPAGASQSQQEHYAAIAVLDACLGAFLEGLDDALESPEETLVVVTSPRGFAWDANRQTEVALSSELLHVPLLIRIPDRTAAAQRAGGFTQPADIFATLCEWLHLEAHCSRWGRSLLAWAKAPVACGWEMACAETENQRAIRTFAWFLVTTTAGERPPCKTSPLRRLFVKPDDYWDDNEVSHRCAEVADQLEQALEQFAACARQTAPEQLPKIPCALQEPPA